ncbi:MAG: M23 family metallopeptidase [Tannerellaceae bacterium]|nr:M23 family metallopeptidase [Tannerellaceae bacterium]
MRFYISPVIYLMTLLYVIPGSAQEFRNPFNFPILLSGNFGELRNNHFHAGIDFKTQGVEGKPIYAVEEGYVSRISVGPFGYGHALYLTHPNGLTTVYGHIQKYSPAIAAYVREQQYEAESFQVNLYPDENLFPVQKGDLIAYAGNTGSSGGPHLHFEVRDTETEEVLDPIPYYKSSIKDTRAPKIQGLMIYPVEGRGMVNRENKKLELKPVTDKNGTISLNNQIEAWGDITVAVKSYDYMDNTANIYGVKSILLQVDGDTIFKSYIDRFALNESRYMNSFIDYEEWKDNRSFFMKSFIEPGNKLRFLKAVSRGIISIQEEKEYKLVYTLTDDYGNEAVLRFTITGKEYPIAAPETTDRHYFHWKSDNQFGAKGIRLFLPRYNLYDDIYFKYTVKEDSTGLAATHILHDKTVPLHTGAQLSIRLQTDTLKNKKQYGIVRLQNGRASWVGGDYRNGWIDTDIRDFGAYSIRQDTRPPVITPINKEKWSANKEILFRVSDNLSGLKSYRGEIDGKFVLFELDGKKGAISFTPAKNEITPGIHTLRFVAEDACGNTAEYEEQIRW